MQYRYMVQQFFHKQIASITIKKKEKEKEKSDKQCNRQNIKFLRLRYLKPHCLFVWNISDASEVIRAVTYRII